MESPIKALEEDIEELKTILTSAKRERTKTLITKELHELDKQLLVVRKTLNLLKAKSSEVKQVESPVGAKKVEIEDCKPIIDFGWEQGDDYTKIYITSGLEGVGSLPKENITTTFSAKGFDLKVRGLKGSNYRYVHKSVNNAD